MLIQMQGMTISGRIYPVTMQVEELDPPRTIPASHGMPEIKVTHIYSSMPLSDVAKAIVSQG